MPITSPYSDEALGYRAKPDPLDDLVRASPPRERMVARAADLAVAAFLLAALFTPIEYAAAVPVVVGDQTPAIADAGRVLLRVDAAALDDASRNVLAALAPGAAVTLVRDTGAAHGRLLGVSDASANGVAVSVRLPRPVRFRVAPTDRAVLRFPAGSRSVAASLAELVLGNALE